MSGGIVTLVMDGDALDYATSLAPEGKEAKSFYWTGDALPFAEAIAMTRKLGVSNMNGGDSRYDGLYPSVAYLAPISRSPNGERQIYAGITNEVLFTSSEDRMYFQLKISEP